MPVQGGGVRLHSSPGSSLHWAPVGGARAKAAVSHAKKINKASRRRLEFTFLITVVDNFYCRFSGVAYYGGYGAAGFDMVEEELLAGETHA